MPVDYTDLYKDWIEFELRHIRDYAQSAEQFFAAELDSHAKYVADMSARVTPEQREQFVDTEIDGYWRFGEARTYLKKVAGVDFPDTAPSWQEIKVLNIIRNVITHGDGHVPEDHPQRDAILQYIRRKPSVSLNHLERFEFSDKFIFETLDLYRTFFADLFAKIAARA